MKKKPKQRTEEEKQSIVEAVNGLRASGMTALEACAQVGVPAPSYGNWERKSKKSKSVSVVVHDSKTPKRKYSKATSQINNRCFIIVTTTENLGNALRGLA